MIRDPIVEEIHKVREKMLRECGGDLHKLFDRLKARESVDKDRVVSRLKRSRETASSASSPN